MKIRIKFAKTGNVRFIGHLDIMRYFQKLIRRAELPIKYSQGFNPHQIMSFAAPLGVGLESVGEYVDIEVDEITSSKKAIDALNHTSTNDIQILQYRLLPDTAKNAMASVACADYKVTLTDIGKEALMEQSLSELLASFLNQEEVMIQREGKKTTVSINIRPWVLDAYMIDDDTIFFKVLTGSSANLKPETVIETMFTQNGLTLPAFALRTMRLEVYGRKSGNEEELPIVSELIPLGDFGEDINE